MSTRRKFLSHIIGLVSLTGTASGLLFTCKPKNEASSDPCLDISDLTKSEIAVREQLGYVESSSIADRTCANCQLFVKPDKSLPCGNCLAMKGPVADLGYCTVWAPVG